MASPTLSRYSRYRGTALVNPLGFAEWRSLPYSGKNDRLYTVTAAEVNRADLISYRFYGTSELWWLVLDYNHLPDSFAIEAGDKLRIPPLLETEALLANRERIQKVIENTLAPAPTSDALFRPSVVVPYVPPTYQSPYTGNVVVVEEEGEEEPFHLFSLLGPSSQPSTNVHFQIQLAAENTFASVLLSRMSAVDQSGWSYFDPTAASGSGDFVNMTAAGLPEGVAISQIVRWGMPDTSGISENVQYYWRYRLVISQIEQSWSTPLPITF